MTDEVRQFLYAWYRRHGGSAGSGLPALTRQATRTARDKGAEMKKLRYYTYTHRPGYGREDHLADDLIARAIRQLGEGGEKRADCAIAQSLGLLSHAVPLDSLRIRVPARRGAAARMRGALRRARREYPHRTYGPDCVVVVELVDD